jgi:hypothetical protein
MSFAKTLFTALTLVLASPALALACPVCFGQSDSPMARGMNLGVLTLLGVTLTVLGAFGAFFIHLMRRARLVTPPQSEDAVSCSKS